MLMGECGGRRHFAENIIFGFNKHLGGVIRNPRNERSHQGRVVGVAVSRRDPMVGAPRQRKMGTDKTPLGASAVRRR